MCVQQSRRNLMPPYLDCDNAVRCLANQQQGLLRWHLGSLDSLAFCVLPSQFTLESDGIRENKGLSLLQTLIAATLRLCLRTRRER